MTTLMRRFLQSVRSRLVGQAVPQRSSSTRAGARPTFEVLEDRVVPAPISGIIEGTAFVDYNRNGVFDRSREPALPGAKIKLQSITLENGGLPVKATAVTDIHGAFRFSHVWPGTYKIVATGPTSLLNRTITVTTGPVDDKNVTKNVAFPNLRAGWSAYFAHLPKNLLKKLAGSGEAVVPTPTFPPLVTSVTITSDNAGSVQTLTANPVATQPNSGVTFTYQWLRNGTPITNATSQTLSLNTVSNIVVGDKFSVKVTPQDSLATGATFTSGEVVIATASPDPITLEP